MTGVSRRAGIGFAIAQRLVADGFRVVVHHHTPHDSEQPWGVDDLDAVLAALPGIAGHVPADLTEPGAPARVVADAVPRVGHLDVLVANHVRSGPDGALADLTAEILDGRWAVDARSTILLVQALLAQHDGRDGGRAVLLTSDRAWGRCRARSPTPPPRVRSPRSPDLGRRARTRDPAEHRQPAPVDTGYATVAVHAEVAVRFLGGRWGRPEDAARLVSWLVGDEGRWIVGQVLHSEGGFRRG